MQLTLHLDTRHTLAAESSGTCQGPAVVSPFPDDSCIYVCLMLILGLACCAPSKIYDVANAFIERFKTIYKTADPIDINHKSTKTSLWLITQLMLCD